MELPVLIDRCQGMSRRTHAPCANPPMTGARFCRLCLPTPSALRPAVPKTGGRPPLHNLYGSYLKEAEQEVYERHYGSFSLLDEVALAKSLLSGELRRRHEAYLQSLEEAELTLDENGELKVPLPPPPLEEGVGDLAMLLERVVRITLAAHQQLVGRRLQVEFRDGETEGEVRRQLRAFVRELLSWIKECLCEECQKRVATELKARRSVEVFSTGG